MFLKNKNESGRSMVEIIGVISVIGVLSIIAIKMVQDLNTQFKLSRIEDAIYKGILLVDGKQVRTKASLESFFRRAVPEFNVAVQNGTDCATTSKPYCYTLVISNTNERIYDAFQADERAPFTTKKENGNILLSFPTNKMLDKNITTPEEN